MMGNCRRCGAGVLEANGYCDSDRCMQEAREYEIFLARNGIHCPDCFEALRLAAGAPQSAVAEPDVVTCPDCAGPLREVDEAVLYCGACGIRHRV